MEIIATAEMGRQYGYTRNSLVAIPGFATGIDRDKLTKFATWLWDNVATTRRDDDASIVRYVDKRSIGELERINIANMQCLSLQELADHVERMRKVHRAYNVDWEEHPAEIWQWALWTHGTAEDWINGQARSLRAHGCVYSAGLNRLVPPPNLLRTFDPSAITAAIRQGHLSKDVEY